MRQIVECVPNFSEGRDMNIIKQITNEIEKVNGVVLLDVDPGADTNRTVVTFVGDPESVKEAAFQAIKKAAELIDMSKHTGAHPRMGATDVCPFVPVAGITMEEVVKIAHDVGKRVGEELNIPIYMYEYAATKPEWKSLAEVRTGEYEALPEKLKKAEWKPDYGPAQFNAKAGATAVGAREFLIAYNVNLNTKSKKLAHKIAVRIREKGRKIKDKNGNRVQVPGRLKETRAIGWYIDDFKRAQISINLTNYKITPPHIAFDTCREEAAKLGIRVTGSELVGLIPKEAMIQAGKYYLEKQGLSTAIPEKEIIHTAILSMGLDELYPFKIEEKIIEYKIENKDKLVKMTVEDFMDELSSESPAPGGGSVAALSASLGTSLIAMVSNLTYGKKGYEKQWNKVKPLGEKAQELKDKFLSLIDEDTDAFNIYMAALKMKKKTEEEKKARNEAIQKAIVNATQVPLKLMQTINEATELLPEMAKRGNQNSISDIGVGALMLESAVKGAYLNVIINVPSIEDEKVKKEIMKEAEEIKNEVIKKCNKTYKKVEKQLLSE